MQNETLSPQDLDLVAKIVPSQEFRLVLSNIFDEIDGLSGKRRYSFGKLRVLLFRFKHGITQFNELSV